MEIKSTIIEAHIFRRVPNNIEFLLMKRAPNQIYAGLWQMITGSVEAGEKGYETVLREIKEETSLKPEDLWIVPNVNCFYAATDDSVNMVPVFVAEVSGNAVVKLSDEHVDYIWCGIDKAKELLAWPGQRKSVEIIAEYFLKEKSLLKLIKIEEM